MYRAHIPNGTIECERYEQLDYGVDLYGSDDEFVAFVPYESLIAVTDISAGDTVDRSVV